MPQVTDNYAGPMLAVPVDLPDDADQALIVLVGVLVMGVLATLTFVVKAWSQAKSTNAAVNHVGVGEPSISENVTHIRGEVDRLIKIQDDFNAKGWQALPGDLGDAPSLTSTIRTLQDADLAAAAYHDTILAKLEALDRAIAETADRLAEHALWEERAYEEAQRRPID